MASLSHWHILGAGAIGCLWAGNLQQAGHAITLISRDDAHQARLKAALPLRITSEARETLVSRPDICTAAKIGRIDNLLICTKAAQTHEAIEAVAYAISPDTSLVLLQNGMGNQQMLAQRFPHNPVYAASTTEAVTRLADLSIAHKATGLTHIGQAGSKADAQLTDKLHCALAIKHCDDINALLWQKLVINCCINPLTAIHNCLNGELARLPQAQHLIPQIIKECRAVAKTQGQHSALCDIEQQVQAVITQTAGNSSSMRQDVHHKKHTEIDFITGYIVSLAQHHDIDIPVNQSLYQHIKRLEHEYC